MSFMVTIICGDGGSVSPQGIVSEGHSEPGTLSTLIVQEEYKNFFVTPSVGYIIDSITVDGVVVDGLAYFSITNNSSPTHSVAIVFAPLIYTITASTGGNGTISPNGVVDEIGYGELKTFTITPSIGFDISDVLVDSVSVGAVSQYTFTNITSDHTISVIFTTTQPPTGPLSGTIYIYTGSDTLTPTITDNNGEPQQGWLYGCLHGWWEICIPTTPARFVFKREGYLDIAMEVEGTGDGYEPNAGTITYPIHFEVAGVAVPWVQFWLTFDDDGSDTGRMASEIKLTDVSGDLEFYVDAGYYWVHWRKYGEVAYETKRITVENV